MRTDFLTYKENERRPLSKKEKLLLILADVVIIIAMFLLAFFLIWNQMINNKEFAYGLGFTLSACCTPRHYFLRKGAPKNEEEVEIEEKTLNINTALILYAVFMLINILLCIFLYPIKIDAVVAKDLFELFKPFITAFLCAFSDIPLKKSKVKDGFRWLFGASFVIPLFIEIIITHIL